MDPLTPPGNTPFEIPSYEAGYWSFTPGDGSCVPPTVVEMGVAEWVSASLFQIGRSYELFAEAMRAFELPEGLSEDEEQVYLDQLAMFIIPMEERALEALAGVEDRFYVSVNGERVSGRPEQRGEADARREPGP